MPVPTPSKDESQSDFMERCMHEVSKNKDRTNKQNVAICLSQWRDSKKTLELPALYRSAQIKSGALDVEKRTVSFSFSSTTPVRRMIAGRAFREVLSHEVGSIDSERLNRGVVPLLWNHNWDHQIGRVIDWGIVNGKGVATAVFSSNQAGEEALRDIKDGIKGSISVGYIPRQVRMLKREVVTEEKENGTDDTKRGRDDPDDDLDDPDDLFDQDDDDDDDEDDDEDDDDTFEVVRWEPIEISLVSVPADMTVGVGRASAEMYEVRVLELPDEVAQVSEVNLSENQTIMAESATPTPPAAPPVTVEVKKEDMTQVREAEILRIREIQSYGEQFKAQDEAQDFIRSGKSVPEFQTYILREKAKNVRPLTTVDPSLGVAIKDQKRYSITRAINAQIKAMRGQGRFDGLEAEVSAELARVHQHEPTGFYVPDWFLTRDLTVTVPPQPQSGGVTIQTSVEPSLIPLLRNRTAVLQAGARYMSGLQGNLLMPRQYAPSTISWNTEIAAFTESDLAMDSVTLSPNRCGGWCNYSKQLLAQSSLDIDNVVRDDMVQVIQIALDAVAITGTGTNQPTGILNTVANAPGTAGPSYAYSKTAPSVIFGPSGYPTWAQVIAFEARVEAGNQILDESACYLTTPSVKGTWKSLAKNDPRNTSGPYYPMFFWEGGIQGTINGYRAIATNQIPGDKVIFGKWNELMIGQWAGLDIVVDIYSLATQAEIRVITNMFADVKYRYASAFCYSTNSGITGMSLSGTRESDPQPGDKDFQLGDKAKELDALHEREKAARHR